MQHSLKHQNFFKKIEIHVNHLKMTLYPKQEIKKKIFDPKNAKDIRKLCRSSKIEEFIQDTNAKYPHLLIFKDKKYNHGVVTQEFIKKNRVICEYLGEIGSLEKAVQYNRVKKLIAHQLGRTTSKEKIKKAIHSYINYITHYAFEISARATLKNTVLAHNKRSIAGFINHNATDPNVVVEIKNHHIYYKAARDIYAGEQLLVDYGPDYDYPDPILYISNIENHLTRAEFLAENIDYYYPHPIKLNALQKRLFQTTANFVMLPRFFHELLNKKNTNPNGYEKKLSILEISDYKKTNNNLILHIPSVQQHITPLMYACSIKDLISINTLIQKIKIDVFAKTIQDKDALIMLIEASHSESDFTSNSKTLIKKFIRLSTRSDMIASDYHKKSALHMLVDREWTKGMQLFDHAIFFDVIDQDGYDPLLFSIAGGKIHAMKTLIRMPIVKKILPELLLAKDELYDGFVLQRALKQTPTDQLNEVAGLIKKYTNNRLGLKKKLNTLLKVTK